MGKRIYFLKIPTKFYEGRTAEFFDGYAMRLELYMLYFKMILLAAQNNGRISRDPNFSTVEWQLANAFKEKRETIQAVLSLFLENDLVIKEENGRLFFPECASITCSESTSTERVRQFRKREKLERRNGAYLDKAMKNTASSRPIRQDDDDE